MALKTIFKPVPVSFRKFQQWDYRINQQTNFQFLLFNVYTVHKLLRTLCDLNFYMLYKKEKGNKSIKPLQDAFS